MFSHVMEDESICIRVIETLLSIQVDHIEYLNFQQSVHPDYDSHGVRFDVYVRNSDRVIDLEMQAVYKTDLLKRARYYQAMLDMDQLQRSLDYDALKESYVVFICLDDPFDAALPRYTFRRVCQELQDTKAATDSRYDDNSLTVFYNAGAWESSDDADIKSFLQYVKTATPSSSLTTDIERAVLTAKQHDPWRREFMTLEMKLAEERKEGYDSGFSEGHESGYATGAAEQRAKDEAEIRSKESELATQAAKLAQYEKLYGKLSQ